MKRRCLSSRTHSYVSPSSGFQLAAEASGAVAGSSFQPTHGLRLARSFVEA
jgi:hypothetical protein